MRCTFEAMGNPEETGRKQQMMRDANELTRLEREPLHTSHTVKLNSVGFSRSRRRLSKSASKEDETPPNALISEDKETGGFM